MMPPTTLHVTKSGLSHKLSPIQVLTPRPNYSDNFEAMLNSSKLAASTMSEGPTAIEVLRRREATSQYQCRNYLGDQEGPLTVDRATRYEMVEWVFKVSAFMKFGEETAVAAAALFDAFLQTEEGSRVMRCLKEYRLASMATFYLAAKLHEHYFVSSEVMSALSHGLYSVTEVERMEMTVLKAMNWHMSPPTSLDFAREFLNLLPCSVSQDTRDSAYELCKAQSKLAVLDYDFVATNRPQLPFLPCKTP
jgi:hypothetical protein